MRFEDSGEPLGVCALLELLLSKLPRDTEDVPIFRRVQARKLGPNEYRGATIGYSRMSALAKQALELVGEDPKEYGLHSGRAGAASLVANARDASISMD